MKGCEIMSDVFNVARFFVDAYQYDEDYITNLKLQKLLYYAHGHYLARTGKPLFRNNVEAWESGPVIPAVYHAYKVCGNRPIETNDNPISRDLFDDVEYNVLLDVLREYGKYSGKGLVDLTHMQGTPWETVYKGNNDIIPNDIIEHYFKNNEPLSSLNDILHQLHLNTDTLRSANGTVLLPADEYEDWSEYDNV